MRTSRMVQLVGCHAEGEVGDVIVGGVPPPPGGTMFDKMRHMARHGDGLRRFLLCEPRGKVSRSVILLTPPTRADCDAGVIIMETTEYVPMSGSNVMCATTVLLETGILPMVEPRTVIHLDTPGGRVRVSAECRDGCVESVEIGNVPCFVDRLGAPLEVAGLGTILVDVAYGGMFYASVDAAALGFAIEPREARDMASLGEKIRLAAREQLPCVHPENPDIRDVTIVQFAGLFMGPGRATGNSCVMAPGRHDRSPTGTGTCARMAILHARGLLAEGEELVHTSIIGGRFVGRITGTAMVGGRPAILPTIRGRAWITGQMSYFLDPSDPFPEGYVVADTWGLTGTLTQ